MLDYRRVFRRQYHSKKRNSRSPTQSAQDSWRKQSYFATSKWQRPSGLQRKTRRWPQWDHWRHSRKCLETLQWFHCSRKKIPTFCRSQYPTMPPLRGTTIPHQVTIPTPGGLPVKEVPPAEYGQTFVVGSTLRGEISPPEKYKRFTWWNSQIWSGWRCWSYSLDLGPQEYYICSALVSIYVFIHTNRIIIQIEIHTNTCIYIVYFICSVLTSKD